MAKKVCFLTFKTNFWKTFCCLCPLGVHNQFNNCLIHAKLFDNMANRIHKFRRIWRKSPRLAVAYLRRKVTRQAKKFLPVDEWNKNWLGEEMRPFNSLR